MPKCNMIKPAQQGGKHPFFELRNQPAKPRKKTYSFCKQPLIIMLSHWAGFSTLIFLFWWIEILI